MFTDEILEKLFTNKDFQKYTISEQAMLIEIFEDVLEEMEEKQKNATLSKS